MFRVQRKELKPNFCFLAIQRRVLVEHGRDNGIIFWRAFLMIGKSHPFVMGYQACHDFLAIYESSLHIPPKNQ